MAWNTRRGFLFRHSIDLMSSGAQRQLLSETVWLVPDREGLSEEDDTLIANTLLADISPMDKSYIGKMSMGDCLSIGKTWLQHWHLVENSLYFNWTIDHSCTTWPLYIASLNPFVTGGTHVCFSLWRRERCRRHSGVSRVWGFFSGHVTPFLHCNSLE